MILDHYNSFDKDYQLFEDTITHGSFGSMKVVINKKTGEYRSVKILNKKLLPDTLINLFYHEIIILKQLDHPNILKLNDVYTDEHFIYILCERIEGHDILEYILEFGYF